jgi:hypothetical protein
MPTNADDLHVPPSSRRAGATVHPAVAQLARPASSENGRGNFDAEASGHQGDIPDLIDHAAAGELLTDHLDDLVGNLENAATYLDDAARDVAGDIACVGNGRQSDLKG